MKRRMPDRLAMPWILIALVFPCLSCTYKAHDQAIATFVVGDVKLYRPGMEARQVRHKDVLKKHDLVKTGKDSFFAFQIGEEAAIRIQPNSSMKISEILEESGNRFYLEDGKLLATVKRLGKEYEIKTNTTVAAIRGTEFSVMYEKGTSVVAVKEGKVSVWRVSADHKVAEEKLVEGGSAAVVTANGTATRPMTAIEGEDFTKSKTVIIQNIQEKSESDLKVIEKEAFNLQGAVPETKAADKPVLQIAEQAQEVTVKDGVQDKRPDMIDAGKEGKDTLIWTSKKSFSSSDTIVVSYRNMPESKYCWMSVAKPGAAGNQYEAYDWTYGKKDGSISFEGLNLAAGEYEARAHFSRSNNIDKKIIFRVE